MNLKTAALTAIIATSIVGCGRTEKTYDLRSPDYWLETYRDFLQDKTAIEQVRSTIVSEQQAIEKYRTEMKGVPRIAWPRQIEENMEFQETALRGHISQYNMMVGSYNTKASDITKKTVDPDIKAKMPYARELEDLTKQQYQQLR